MMERIKILGIDFYNRSIDNIYTDLYFNGGFMTVPSGPGLASIPTDQVYYESLLNSDYVIADSGYMALIWNTISNEKINRISGLEFVNYFLSHLGENNKQIFLVNPTSTEGEANQALMNSLGASIGDDDMYIAPFYKKGQIIDPELLQILEKKKPHWIFLNIGGGVQEILGSYLKDHLSYKPAIICTGAAIAFKTGNQVDIPVWVDKFYLGWLWRIIAKPKVYTKRYWDAKSLFVLLLKYKSKAFVYK